MIGDLAAGAMGVLLTVGKAALMGGVVLIFIYVLSLIFRGGRW